MVVRLEGSFQQDGVRMLDQLGLQELFTKFVKMDIQDASTHSENTSTSTQWQAFQHHSHPRNRTGYESSRSQYAQSETRPILTLRGPALDPSSMTRLSNFERPHGSSGLFPGSAGLSSGTFAGPAGSMFFCFECNKDFPDGWRLRRHNRAVHEHIVHPCVCGKSYKYKGDLGKHQKQCCVYQNSTECPE